MGLSLTEYSNFLKTWYRKYPMNMWMYNKESPLMGMLPKKSWGGENIVQPIFYGLPAARSRTFSTALAKSRKNSGNLRAGKVTFQADSDYALFNVDGKTVAAAEKNEFSYAKALQQQSDMQRQALINNRSTLIYGDGSTSRGTVASIVSGRSQFVVTQPTMTNSLGVGMEIQFSATARGGTLRAGGPYTITRINRQTRNVWVDKALNSAVATNDRIFQDGDYITGTDQVFMGLEGFCPDSLSSTDSFRGINRSTDRVRLAGLVYSQQSGVTVENTLLNACAQLSLVGGRVDCIFMNDLRFNQLVVELGPRVRYNRDDVRSTKIGKIGFSYIEINTSGARGGVAKVYSDPYCPVDKVWGLDMTPDFSPEIYYLGSDFVFLDKIDGNNYLRQSDADGVEGRHKSYANMHVPVPLNLLKINMRAIS